MGGGDHAADEMIEVQVESNISEDWSFTCTEKPQSLLNIIAIRANIDITD